MGTLQLSSISVRGVVQGVGFRPFVYRLAHKYGLKGWVSNTSESVQIEVEGGQQNINLFYHELLAEAPPAARIESVSATDEPPKGHRIFEIRSSITDRDGYGLVSPDLATCEQCQKEIFNPSDRRYHYAFTNCTDCGPRYTIIRDMPYDRQNTTMQSFRMCPRCHAEYDDPMQRRFHAQPNACPVCGPSLELLDSEGGTIATDDVIPLSASLLKQGKILAVKGLGGFLLACDATNEKTVNLLRHRKNRPAKPLAVMVKDIAEARLHCNISEEEAVLLHSPAAPIVLLPWLSSSTVCRSVAPGLLYLGLMLPYTPLHHLLLGTVTLPLVMTSGNISEEPIAADNREALSRLGKIADYFLMHNRDIAARYDDSVAFVLDGCTQMVRRARGYAPFPLHINSSGKTLLAMGADEKNTFCLVKEHHAFVSQHIGEMDNLETHLGMKKTLLDYEYIFRARPQLIVHDMHPDYRSTALAIELGAQKKLPTLGIQHHHAHIASCMADNMLDGKVIGVAFDGTGYGMDGNIWGGEFMFADYKGFQRFGHLQYLPLPGGESAIRYTYRIAAAYLYSLLQLPLGQIKDRLSEYGIGEELDVILKQITHNLNTPMTSSMGRLFDAVSALLGICGAIQYEAQAAIMLEMVATNCGCSQAEYYQFKIQQTGETCIISPDILFREILSDQSHARPTGHIAFKFHQSIAVMITKVCSLMRSKSGINEVALSGGVFQNRLLLGMVLSALRMDGFNVYTHKLVPCNDGGISLGQAAIALSSFS